MRIRPIFAWHDLWIGAFFDRAKRRLYVFPVPMFGFYIERSTPSPQPNVAGATIDRQRATKAAEAANQAYGHWMPERWLHLFLDAYEGKSK